MRILFITAGYLPMPPVQGGAVENLIDLFLLNNDLSRKHEVAVYSCFSKEAEKASSDYRNCSFIYIKTQRYFFKMKQILLFIINKYKKRYIGNAFIREVRKSIVHAKDEFDLVIVENRPEFIIILREIFKEKVVLHLHNDYLYNGVKGCKKIVDLYDGIFLVSNYIRQRILTVNSETPVTTLFNGIDLNRFDDENYKRDIDTLRKIYNIRKDDVVILYTGRLNPSKGVHQLLKAFVLLPEIFKSKLIIVGSSKYGRTSDNSFLKLLKKIGKKRENDIIFTGYINYDEIPKLYAMADIGVVPSIAPEAFSLTVLEHLASGNPVITTSVGGIAEIINEQCAIKIKNDEKLMSESIRDALIKLCTDKQLRYQMSLAAKKAASRYSKSKFCDNFNQVIEEVAIENEGIPCIKKQ